jgi:hypothetical protein
LFKVSDGYEAALSLNSYPITRTPDEGCEVSGEAPRCEELPYQNPQLTIQVLLAFVRNAPQSERLTRDTNGEKALASGLSEQTTML